MNYYEPNLCYESNYSGFDHFQPPQYSVIHQPPHEKTIGELLAEERAANIDQSPPQEMSIQDIEDLKQHYLDEMKSLINDLQIKDYRNERIDIQYRRECEIRIDELKHNFNGMSIEIRKKEKELLQQEQAAYVRTSQRFNFIYYNDDNDEESSIPLSGVISELPPCVAITPVLSTEEPVDSLIMKDEHLDTILATELDEVIKSSVEDLVPIPSESEGIFGNMCDVPFCDKNHFDAESDLMQSLLNRDTSIIYSPKIDSLLEEFADELAPINPIPSGIHLEEDIRLIEQLLYDDTLSDDDSYEDIDYVDASPPDSELVSLEEVKDFHPKDGEIEDDILREKLSKINLLIAKIESLNTNPTPSSDFVTKSPSTFLNFFLEETNTFDNS
ncbi:hypothetical protein Tco_0930847, partial [Tanacetum coccineum]